jgi:hypothetical protein
MVVPGNVRREANSLTVPTSVVRRVAYNARFLVATARSTFENKDYIVEVGVPKRPIKAVFRETAIRMQPTGALISKSQLHTRCGGAKEE